MVCYAVAVAGAQVTEDHIRKYLTPDAITAPITAYLKAKFPDAEISHYGRTDEVIWSVVLAGQVQTIAVCAGQITTRNYQQDPSTAEAIATEIQQALTAIGVAYWQNETYQFLAANYAITESQKTADGSLVVRLRV